MGWFADPCPRLNLLIEGEYAIKDILRSADTIEIWTMD